LPLSEHQRKRIAKKAVKTRKERKRHQKGVERAHKAGETTEKSEKGYIPKLARLLGVSQRNVFHHIGLPDLLVIRSSGEIGFYEIKPKKAEPAKRLLNRYQKETVKRLLNIGLKDVYVVKYEKRENRYYYDKPIRLTKENLNEHCL